MTHVELVGQIGGNIESMNIQRGASVQLQPRSIHHTTLTEKTERGERTDGSAGTALTRLGLGCHVAPLDQSDSRDTPVPHGRTLSWGPRCLALSIALPGRSKTQAALAFGLTRRRARRDPTRARATRGSVRLVPRQVAAQSRETRDLTAPWAPVGCPFHTRPWESPNACVQERWRSRRGAAGHSRWSCSWPWRCRC